MSILNKIKFYVAIPHINMGLNKGALTANTRRYKADEPTSWEFSAFSENGEDGITDELLKQLINPNRNFLEIGSGNGIHNNSAYLAVALKYGGLMVDGNPSHIARAQNIYSFLNSAVTCTYSFINDQADVNKLRAQTLYTDPDFFSLDIDGIDYYVMKMLLESGFLPKIICAEINSAFGPTASITIPYAKNFNRLTAHPSALYFGVSVTGWKNFLKQFGYEFVTVCSNGINAFFVHRESVEKSFLDSITNKGLHYAECYTFRQHFKCNWKEQFSKVEHLEFATI